MERPRAPSGTTPVENRVRADPECNLGNFFKVQVASRPEAVAIIDLSRPEPRTFGYRELEDRIQRAVAVLRSAGVRRGLKVAVALPNSIEFLEIFLGALRLGAIPVPLNQRLGRDGLRFALRDSESRAIVADPDDAATCCEIAEECGIEHRIAILTGGAANISPGWVDYDEAMGQVRPDPHVQPMRFEEQAFQPYTSGSTGLPKGICLTHGGMLWGIEHREAYAAVPPSERGIVAAPLYHKNAMRGVVKPLLRAGASVVILRRFEARSYLRALTDYRVTQASGVPAMFADILRHRDLVQRGSFDALHLISLGSSTVPVELMDRLRGAFPNAKIKESYGLTEGGGPFAAAPDGRPTPPGSVGVPAPETEVLLVDEAGQPDEHRGELWIRSPYVLSEYVNQPELTAEKIRDGWLRTGDLFRVDEAGFYAFLGRIDDMFVCGGENIYPREVEDVLLKHHAIADAVVLPLSHESKGHAPAAVISCRPGRHAQAREVQDFCSRNGPAYAVPRGILILPEIPLTGAGKPDRAQIRNLLVQAFGTLASRGSGDTVGS